VSLCLNNTPTIKISTKEELGLAIKRVEESLKKDDKTNYDNLEEKITTTQSAINKLSTKDLNFSDLVAKNQQEVTDKKVSQGKITKIEENITKLGGDIDVVKKEGETTKIAFQK